MPGGAREALERLYEDCAAPGFGFALRMVKEPAWAEDLLQDAFLRVAGRLPALREPAADRAYFWRTLANLALDGLRRARRSPVRTEPQPPERPGPSDPAVWAERRDQVRVVEAALEELEPRERAAVLLRVTGGLHYREVGEALGLTDRGAARVVASALERLRRLLGRPGAADAREPERRNACEPARR